MNEENTVVAGKIEVGIIGCLIEGRIPNRVIVARIDVAAVRAVGRGQLVDAVIEREDIP